MQYNYSIKERPSDLADLKECSIQKHINGTSGMSTVLCGNSRTPIMKSLRIYVPDGIPIKVAEVNIYAAGT